MNKTAYGTTLILFLVGSLSLLSNILPVKTEPGVIYIRADGSVDPPTAPIQRDGDVYTLTGNITSSGDGIIVEKNDVTVERARSGVLQEKKKSLLQTINQCRINCSFLLPSFYSATGFPHQVQESLIELVMTWTNDWILEFSEQASWNISHPAEVEISPAQPLFFLLLANDNL